MKHARFTSCIFIKIWRMMSLPTEHVFIEFIRSRKVILTQIWHSGTFLFCLYTMGLSLPWTPLIFIKLCLVQWCFFIRNPQEQLFFSVVSQEMLSILITSIEHNFIIGFYDGMITWRCFRVNWLSSLTLWIFFQTKQAHYDFLSANQKNSLLFQLEFNQRTQLKHLRDFFLEPLKWDLYHKHVHLW